MSDFLPFIVVGLVSGSIYGVAGMGLVLTYKATGIFNFAHGAVAAAAAYVFFDLHYTHGVPAVIAFVIAVPVFGTVSGLSIERLARRLADAHPAMTVVATVGLALAIQGFLQWKYGLTGRDFPQFLPKGTAMRIAGVDISVAQLVTVAIGAAGAAAVYQLFRRTRVGLAMRGVVDDPSLLGLAGTSPARTRAVSWVIGCTFAALSGVLIAPTLGLDAILLTLLVVQAFGAAAIGRFTDAPLTYVGGLVVGVAAALTTKFTQPYPVLSGAPAAVPFLILFLVLLITPRRKLVERPYRPRPSRERTPLPARLRYGAGVPVAVVLLAVPALVGAKLPVFTSGLAFVFIFLSLGLLVWTSGQISLCQAAFAAVGATAFAHATTGLGLPWLGGLIVAGLATIPLGVVVALPAIRLSGIYLALATFGFGILVERVAYRFGVMFGGDGFRVASRPRFGSLDATTDRGFYYLSLLLVVAGCLLVAALVRSRLGRFLRALGDSPVGLEAQGLKVNTTRVLVFCLSAFLAGVGGALIIAGVGTANGNTFTALNSLIWLAVLAAVRIRSLVPAAFLAAGALAVVPVYFGEAFTTYSTMAFGVAAIAAALPTAQPLWARTTGRAAERTGAGPVGSRSTVERKPRQPEPVPAMAGGVRYES